MIRYLRKTVQRLNHIDPKRTNLLRGLWMEAHGLREKALKKFRTDGLKGKDYSDAVVKFDKDLQSQVSGRQNAINNMVI